MKKFLCLIALLFASAGLVGCVVPGVTPGGATGKTTITFWHAMGQSNQVIIQEMIDSFEKAYPMFEVEHYSQGGYTDLRDKILQSIPVGEAPTIAQAYPDHIANYLNAKAAQELDSYIDNTNNEFGSQALKELQDLLTLKLLYRNKFELIVRLHKLCAFIVTNVLILSRF